MIMLFSPGYSLVGGPAPAVPRPFLGPPLLAPHHPLHPLLYSHQAAIPRTGFTLPGSATTLFPLPGTFPWSSGFRGELEIYTIAYHCHCYFSEDPEHNLATKKQIAAEVIQSKPQ